jgi:hypothetical protein
MKREKSPKAIELEARIAALPAYDVIDSEATRLAALESYDQISLLASEILDALTSDELPPSESRALVRSLDRKRKQIMDCLKAALRRPKPNG